MNRIYKWCLNKVRSTIGAVGFLLPRVHLFPPKARRMTAFRRRFVTALFAVLAGALIFSPTCYSSAFGPNDFTYTGTYTWIEDGGSNFRLKFLTSGTFTPLKPIMIDLFLVGGGGGGKSVTNSSGGGSGGGGGYTGTWTSIYLNANQAYPLTIGSGGASNSNGGSTTGFGHSASGGYGASVLGGSGGNGGSGGGAYANGGTAAGTGGSNGGNGTSVNGVSGGTGQGSTTYEFANAGLTLYSGAGGGGGSSTSTGGAAGGSGGGANGGAGGQNGSSASANTGGGGGGAGYIVSGTRNGGSGGSGLCAIRNHR